MCPHGAYDVKIAVAMQCKLEPFLHKKPLVGIFGAGLSGKGAANLCKALHWSYELLDEQEAQSPRFESYGLCIFSPGFAPHHPWRIQAQRAHALCVNELDFAATCFTNPIIAVTGTNGKTSVTELMAQLLRDNGQEALSVGNNGRVLSQAVADAALSDQGVYVCEVSSFQAASLQWFRPMCTLWTNFAPDHLDYHGGLKEYFLAKYHLLTLTDGPCICGPNLREWMEHFGVSCPTLQFVEPDAVNNQSLTQFPNSFSYGQRENFALIQTYARLKGIDDAIVAHCLTHFKQAPHRLHCCCKTDTMAFWNDSKGTNLHAVKAALESLKHLPHLHWILGGGGKGEALQGFIDLLNAYPIEQIYLVGETGEQLFEQAHQFHAPVQHCKRLEQVFIQLPQNEPFNLVLSPGFTSWDQFKSYAERGDLFERLAQQYIAAS